MDKIKLKPCPFCGGRAKISDHEPNLSLSMGFMDIKCVNCGCRITKGSEKIAVKSWNKRENKKSKIKKIFNRFIKEHRGAVLLSVDNKFTERTKSHLLNESKIMFANKNNKYEQAKEMDLDIFMLMCLDVFLDEFKKFIDECENEK